MKNAIMTCYSRFMANDLGKEANVAARRPRRGGFTLVELLVVVLIIGILSSVALPQYQKAVDKSRVATILPIMRNWIDAMAIYKLETGAYPVPGGDPVEITASWPSDWETDAFGLEAIKEGKWYCFASEEHTGNVYCEAQWKSENERFTIVITQPDETLNKYPKGKRFCTGNASFCKSLGGKEITGFEGNYEF